MSKPTLFAPNGKLVDRTLETLNAGQRFSEPHPDPENPKGFEFEWGSTDDFWEEQRTVVNMRGQRMFLDVDGEEWPEDSLRLVDTDAESVCPEPWVEPPVEHEIVTSFGSIHVKTWETEEGLSSRVHTGLLWVTDQVMSLILAQASMGIDFTTEEYRDAIQTFLDALDNESTADDRLLEGCVEAVDYYHDHEGCPELRRELYERLGHDAPDDSEEE